MPVLPSPPLAEKLRVTHSFLRAGPGAILILLIVLAAAGSAPAAGTEGPPIASIEVRGNSRTPSADVLSILGLKTGDPYSPHAVTEGVKRLLMIGLLVMFLYRTKSERRRRRRLDEIDPIHHADHSHIDR